MQALYRADSTQDWQDCEIIGRHSDGYVLREVGRALPGVWIATRDQVRVPVGVIEQPAIVARNYLPAGLNRQGKYRYLREVVGPQEALRLLGESP